jgi:hypothetical protein
MCKRSQQASLLLVLVICNSLQTTFSEFNNNNVVTARKTFERLMDTVTSVIIWIKIIPRPIVKWSTEIVNQFFILRARQLWDHSLFREARQLSFTACIDQSVGITQWVSVSEFPSDINKLEFVNSCLNCIHFLFLGRLLNPVGYSSECPFNILGIDQSVIIFYKLLWYLIRFEIKYYWWKIYQSSYVGD